MGGCRQSSRVPVSHPKSPGAKNNARYPKILGLCTIYVIRSFDLGLSLHGYAQLSSQSQLLTCTVVIAISLVTLTFSRYMHFTECAQKAVYWILPFFSLAPHFAITDSLSLFCEYSCTFRSSVLFCFASFEFLQFIGEFFFYMCACVVRRNLYANYNCVPT